MSWPRTSRPTSRRETSPSAEPAAEEHPRHRGWANRAVRTVPTATPLRRLYHGGPAGLRGEILPASATIPDVPGAMSWVWLTEERRLARYFAAARAVQLGKSGGTVYIAEPAGDLEPDVDAPWTWRAPSARITGVACMARASEAQALQRWLIRWAPSAFADWDAALGISGWRNAAVAGRAPAGVLGADGLTKAVRRHAGRADPDGRDVITVARTVADPASA